MEYFIANPDNPYNFLAFSVKQFNNVYPYIDSFYSSSVEFWGLHYFEIKIGFLIVTILLAAFIFYLISKISKTMEKRRRVCVQEYVGFDVEKTDRLA